jgi:hypothetical protein
MIDLPPWPSPVIHPTCTLDQQPTAFRPCSLSLSFVPVAQQISSSRRPNTSKSWADFHQILAVFSSVYSLYTQENNCLAENIMICILHYVV